MMKRKYLLIGTVVFLLGVLIATTVVVLAGSPDSPSPPESTFSFNLEDIYKRLETGAAGTQTAFTEPSVGPGSGTMSTLNEIMAMAPVVDDVNGVSREQVPCGTYYWSLRSDEWGLQGGLLGDIWYLDADGDLYSGGTSQNSCDDPGSDWYLAGSLTAIFGDCDDTDENVNPDAVEICNGIDDDCTGITSDGEEDPLLGQPCDGDDADVCIEGIYTECAGGSLTCSDDPDDPCSAGTHYIGSVSGDTSGSPPLTDSWNREAWDRFLVTEDDSLPTYLSAKIDLVSPPGVNYDLYAWCDSCGGTYIGSSTISGMTGHTDTLYVRAEDEWGVPDDFYVIVEVRIESANVCDDWQLTVTGYVSTGTTTCN